MFFEFIFQKILEGIIIWLLKSWVEWKWNVNLSRLKVICFFLNQIVKNLIEVRVLHIFKKQVIVAEPVPSWECCRPFEKWNLPDGKRDFLIYWLFRTFFPFKNCKFELVMYACKCSYILFIYVILLQEWYEFDHSLEATTYLHVIFMKQKQYWMNKTGKKGSWHRLFGKSNMQYWNEKL